MKISHHVVFAVDGLAVTVAIKAERKYYLVYLYLQHAVITYLKSVIISTLSFFI